MDWFKSYPADYRDDTWHLSLAEHGAYKLLIDHYMHHEKPLPDNDRALASIIGVSVEDWILVSSNVREFFTQKRGKLTHKRCEEELNVSFDKRKDGKKRVAKYRKSLSSVTHDKRVSNAPRGEERRGEENKEVTNVTKKVDEVSYLEITELWNSKFSDTNIPKIVKLTDARKKAIKNRFEDTFENNISFFEQTLEKIKASPFLMGSSGSFNASLDWVLKPANLTKILEGNYDKKFNNSDSGPNGGTSAVAARNQIVAELEEEQRKRSGGSGNQTGMQFD